jgi:predicted RNA methylase
MNANTSEREEKLQTCIKMVSRQIDEDNAKLDNRELLEICRSYLDSAEENPHIYHEIAETAVNLLIMRKYAAYLLAAENPANACREIIKPLAGRLPTQTWRSREQELWQQFSTPPAIAYLLAYLMNFRQEECVLEPSAGTGSLAVWASGAGFKTHVNEIDERRAELLRVLGFSPSGYNAEFIHDYLPQDLKIDCVMMNPPFSASGGRMERTASKFGFRHVSSALERLKAGGRFGIILGNAAGLDARAGNEFWRKLADRICLKAVFKISGREYYKNGTSVDVNVFIGEKLPMERKVDWNREQTQIAQVSARTVEEAFNAAQNLNLRLNR